MSNALDKLYQNWETGTATEEERLQLLALLAAPDNKVQALQLIKQAVEKEAGTMQDTAGLDEERLEMIFTSIVAIEAEPGTEKPQPAVHKPVRYINTWVKYAAAVIFLVVLASGLYWWVSSSDKDKYTDQVVDIRTIGPGSEKATLTLSDGTTITLDSAGKGMLAQEGEVLITKTENGEIVYHLNGENNGSVLMNTMTTPKGGQYQLVLPDGTKVWLNAASSLTYPAAFTANSRMVTVTGEAYFEVKKDTRRPFLVNIAGQATVEVTGTSFNINAYADEPEINTTLLEGAVKMHVGIDKTTMDQPVKGSNDKTVSLFPGQQAKLPQVAAGKDSPGFSTVQADTEKVIAWKNGQFNFEGIALKDAMRQISRWYDIDIKYDKNVEKKGLQNTILVGGFSRELSLSNILDVFTALGLHFKMEKDRTLFLLP